jgi:hypothetical protein
MSRSVVRLVRGLLVLCLTLPTQSVYAWSEGGHHLIALIAFELLTEREQNQILTILGRHPRYREDFTPPDGLPTDRDRVLWQVGRAGYWPDIARRYPQYHRSTWHYELGPALVLGNRAGITIPDRPGPVPEAATLETQELHISQAIRLASRTLGDTSSPAADRALALCWLAHLVGDAHQPCHAGSLYAEGVFTEADGDRGANRIPTKQRRNLHALWDGLLGEDFSLSTQRRQLVEIRTDSRRLEEGQRAITGPGRLDPLIWLEESRSASVQHVYTPEVLATVQRVARGLVAEPEQIELSETYLKNAGQVAQRRAVEAGYRLAETWKICLRADP